MARTLKSDLVEYLTLCEFHEHQKPTILYIQISARFSSQFLLEFDSIQNQKRRGEQRAIRIDRKTFN